MHKQGRKFYFRPLFQCYHAMKWKQWSYRKKGSKKK